MLAVVGQHDERVVGNKRELARAIDVSLPTLTALQERYPDAFVVIRSGGNGREYQYDITATVRNLAAIREREDQAAMQRLEGLDQLKLDLGAAAPAESDTADRLSPAQRLQLARARREERRMALEDGLLVPADGIRSHLSEALTDLSRFLDALPGDLGRRFNLPPTVVDAMAQDIAQRRQQFVERLRSRLLPAQPRDSRRAHGHDKLL